MERIRTLFNGRVYLSVIFNQIQTAVFGVQSPGFGHISSLYIDPGSVNLITALSF